MHILMEIDLSLYMLLFALGGGSGVLVKIDRWVDGDEQHPTNEDGSLNIAKSVWSYILTFILSGLAGTMVAVGTTYFLSNHDTNIMLLATLTVGAIGRLIFYKLVEWVHDKFDNSVTIAHKVNATTGPGSAISQNLRTRRSVQ